MKKNIDPIRIYTDGSCHPNPGRGGWASIIIQSGEEIILSGRETQTTNNRMELTAAINALEHLPSGTPIILHTDSEYLKKGIEEWLPGWEAKNWKGSKGKVANRDLWERLSAVTRRHAISWKWLKGHAGNHWNEIVDRLARDAAFKG